MDGIDVAYLESNGQTLQALGGHRTVTYTDVFLESLRSLIAGEGPRKAVEEDLTRLHAVAVETFLREENISPSDVDLVGFHGHTIAHDPSQGLTDQIGDGQFLADLLGLPVVNDLRLNDVAQGGQGAPLAPVFHAALFKDEPKPLAVLNIGGVANVTWIGEEEDQLIAFDTGPGNALIDDWIGAHGAGRYDEGGRIAASGSVDTGILGGLMSAGYFNVLPPKSLDRNDFGTAKLEGLSLEDGAATLSAFTVDSISRAAAHFPASVARWIVCGGGRHNEHLMDMLAGRVSGDVLSADDLGWNGDAIEAQAFAYMAIRSDLGLPISFPGTTGAPAPLTGGQKHQPQMK